MKEGEVEIIAFFREINMRKLQSIHSYRQMASCPRREKSALFVRKDIYCELFTQLK